MFLLLLVCTGFSIQAQNIYYNGSRIGEIEDDGDVYYKGNRVGECDGVRRDWAAAFFFFFFWDLDSGSAR